MTFVAGRRGTFSIPYDQIHLVEFGPGLATPGSGSYEFGGSLWGAPGAAVYSPGTESRRYDYYKFQPLDECAPKWRYLLTIVYGREAELTVSFELGANVVRPILQVLEDRRGRAVTFRTVSACMLYRTAEECGAGSRRSSSTRNPGGRPIT